VLAIYQNRVPALKHTGTNSYTGTCPFHEDKTPSFVVSLYKDAWSFRCFGSSCEARGDVLNLVQKLDDCSLQEAVVKVRAELGLPPASEIEYSPKTLSLEDYDKLELALSGAEDGRKWLMWRGVGYKTAKQLRLGYRESLAGLCKDSRIVNKGWICFPCIEGGRVVALKYRSIVTKAFCKEPGMAVGDQTPLFNSESVEPLEPVYVTEGELDCGVLVQAGFRAVSVQSASTPLTPANKEKLAQASYVVLAGDNDQGGLEFMTKLGHELQGMGKEVRLIKWPGECKDANDAFVLCKGSKDHFKNLVNELSSEEHRLLEPWEKMFRTVDELDKGEEEFLIDKVLTEGNITYVAGPPETGKTWFTLSMVKALTTGKKFLRLFDVSKPVDVLYLTPESGDRPLRKRLEKMHIRERFRVRTMNDGPISLTDPDLATACSRLRPVIVLDTLRRFAQGDENDSQEANRLAGEMYALIRAGAKAVICIHHVKKSATGTELEDLRGSGDFGAQCGAIYTLKRVGDPDNLGLQVHNTKQKEGIRLKTFEIQGFPGIKLEGDFRVIETPEAIKVKKLAEATAANPEATIRKLAEITGISKSEVGRMVAKKEEAA
jgi:hypothetical protein